MLLYQPPRGSMVVVPGGVFAGAVFGAKKAWHEMRATSERAIGEIIILPLDRGVQRRAAWIVRGRAGKAKPTAGALTTAAPAGTPAHNSSRMARRCTQAYSVMIG